MLESAAMTDLREIDAGAAIPAARNSHWPSVALHDGLEHLSRRLGWPSRSRLSHVLLALDACTHRNQWLDAPPEILLDVDEAGNQETLDLAKAGGAALALKCDVSSLASVEAARDAVRARFGDAQVLVNVAGINRRGSMDTCR